MIDEVAYKLYKTKCNNIGYDYVKFNIFIKRKNNFKPFYDEAFIIERKYKLGKIMK